LTEEVSGAPAARAPQESWDGTQLLAALQAGARWLAGHAEALNALNVFPVPDGDTGTNMTLTLNSALEAVLPAPSCASVAERVGYWAMMRGRGNSGIILSQVLRGFAQGLAGYERLDAAALARGLAQASATAYQAVMKPIEGTMLTVIREASEAARAAAAGGAGLVETLLSVAQAAQAAVQRTPSLLKALRDAGVVDSGGQGLALLLEGMARYAQGQPLEPAAPAPLQPAAAAEAHGPDAFGYCTNFVIQGVQMPFEQIRSALSELGQSVAVAGDAELIKVHLHTLRPGDALNYAVQHGTLTGIEITNMDDQHAALAAHAGARPALPAPEADAPAPLSAVGVVAVASGAGFAAIFRSLNAGAVVEGGPSSNPSTADLLEAIEHLPQREVLVLPNNSNVIMAARQAADLSPKRVQVVATRTLPQGLAALLRFNYQAGLETNRQAMEAAAHHVCTGELTTAVRDATVDGVQVRAGQTIGLLDGDLVVAEDAPDAALQRLLEHMHLDQREIVAIYYGQGRTQHEAETLAQQIRERYPSLDDAEVQAGGQTLYDYIISAE
jgi:DAK2 domain fusion protein YloV